MVMHNQRPRDPLRWVSESLAIEDTARKRQLTRSSVVVRGLGLAKNGLGLHQRSFITTPSLKRLKVICLFYCQPYKATGVTTVAAVRC